MAAVAGAGHRPPAPALTLAVLPPPPLAPAVAPMAVANFVGNTVAHAHTQAPVGTIIRTTPVVGQGGRPSSMIQIEQVQALLNQAA